MAKVLILGLSFNNELGVGVTLTNLFSKFSASEIAIIDYKVSFENIKYSDHIFSLLENSNTSKNILKHSKTPPNSVKFTLYLKKTLSTRYFKKYLSFYYNNFSKFLLTEELISFIKKFNPNYIYVVPYNRKIIKLTFDVVKLTNIPIVLHFMDDYRHRSPHDFLYLINEKLNTELIHKVVEKSYKRLAICDSMAREYESIFNKEFKYFHNPINTDSFKTSIKNKSLNCLKVLYTGTIAENNFDSLLFFANNFEKLGSECNNIIFDIYAPVMSNNPFYNKFSNNIRNYKFVKLNDGVCHEKLLSLMYEYDMLFLPLTFKKKYQSVIKVSFPTKVAEYMASGIPTLYFIPQNIALHEFIRDNKIGFLIDNPNSNEVYNFLFKVLKGDIPLIYDKIASDIAFTRFDVNKVSTEFKDIFN